MKLPLKAVLIGGFFVLPSIVTLAQSGPASVSVALQMRTGYTYKTGSPYCATKEYLPAQTPPDRTKVSHAERICRDSLGRGRDEVSPTLIEIYDPVEGVGYTLDSAQRKAGRTVFALPASADSSTSQPRMASLTSETPQSRVELLGTEVIEGLVLEGTRITTSDPVVAWSEQVEERWFSRELGEVIVMKRSGEVVWRLRNIERAEPDPSLFRVSANYTIADTPDYGDVPTAEASQ